MANFEKIQAVIAEQLSIEPDKITPDTTFESLGADSLDIFQVITELEEIYNMEFDTTDADKIKSVGDAVTYVTNAIS